MACPDEPSWRSEDTVRLAKILSAHGVDFLDVSTSGSNLNQKIKGGPAYQAPFAHDIKKVIHTDSTSNLIVGRQFQKNPFTVWVFAEDLGVEVVLPHQIAWGFKGRGKK